MRVGHRKGGRGQEGSPQERGQGTGGYGTVEGTGDKKVGHRKRGQGTGG